jgi:hypothetical protein
VSMTCRRPVAVKGAFVAMTERTYLPESRFAMENHDHAGKIFLRR